MSCEAVVYCGCSLDGYIARSDFTLDFLETAGPVKNPAEEQDMGFTAFVSGCQALVMGRRTFDVAKTSVADGNSENWPKNYRLPPS